MNRATPPAPTAPSAPTAATAVSPTARDAAALTTAVLVIGAGPTGLMLGCLLRDLGVECTVVEQREAIDPRTRAVMVHAAGLEILEGLGLRTALEERGVRQRRIDFHTAHGAVFSIDFSGLDTDFPYYLNVPQPEVEELLAQRFTALGGRLLRGLRYVSHREDGTGVDVELRYADPDSTPTGLNARYLVAADGASSAVRTALGIDFPGVTYPMSYLLAEGAPRVPADPDASAMYIGPAGAVSLLPLPHGTVRIAGPVSAEFLERDSELGAEEFRRSVETLGFGETLAFERIDRIAHYQVHERLAERFTEGRTVLAGDAAHLNSPAGGQAMNTGFADAWALAWRFAALLDGGDAALLDGYAEERRAAAAEVARSTGVLGLLDVMRRAETPAARSSVAQSLDGYARTWSQLPLAEAAAPVPTHTEKEAA